MNFQILDPRPIPVATEANEKVFAAGPVYGIEVTVPALATRCVANIDPQHARAGDATLAAIEVALTAELPPAGATLATVRADLDSVGAMAVFLINGDYRNACLVDPNTPVGQLCYYGVKTPLTPEDTEAMARIRMVADADKFARGGWPGVHPLPTKDNPWPEQSASAESSRPLAAIAAAVADFKVPLATRVETMARWLLFGEEPEKYRAQVEKERLDMIVALETGAIKYETHSEGRIAVVESTHRAATMVGYSLAPVVVALNPSFRQGPGEPYKKFTICAFESQFADIKVALAELATLEAGWGGSPTIGGSPQGVSSALTIDQVVIVVEKHLR